MRRPSVAYGALALAALLFGATFVVVKQAIVTLPPLPFIGWRFLVGAALLLLLAPPRGVALWRDGLVAGLALFAGYALQTEGLAHTSAANSGLITGLYVVFTPILASILGRRRLQGWVITGTGVAFVGLALVTVQHGITVGVGDLLTVGCAIAFAVHVVILSRTAGRHPVVPFTAVQLLVTAVAALAIAALRGPVPLPDASTVWAVVLTGVVVSAGAFLLQVWSQTIVGPSRTAVVLALEPAFAALSAYVVLGERLGLRGWAGAALILAGIYLVLARTSEPTAAAEAITPAH